MSTLQVATIKSSSSAAPQFQNSSGVEKGQLCKAWIHFDGQDTVAIRDSFNVSTLTDNGTGDYTISFTNAMANTNYAVATSQPAQHNFTQAILGIEQDHSSAFATGSIRVQSVKTGNNAAVDRDVQCVVIFGD